MKLWSTRKPQFPDTEPLSQPMHHSGDTSDAPTVPQPLEPLAHLPTDRPGGAPSRSPASAFTLQEALAEIRKDNRISPLPTRWLEFYRLLRQEGDGSPLPAEPLIGSAWAATPPLAKRMCFREQVEWADAHGCLGPAVIFLKSLPESDWNYVS